MSISESLYKAYLCAVSANDDDIEIQNMMSLSKLEDINDMITGLTAAKSQAVLAMNKRLIDLGFGRCMVGRDKIVRLDSLWNAKGWLLTIESNGVGGEAELAFYEVQRKGGLVMFMIANQSVLLRECNEVK